MTAERSLNAVTRELARLRLDEMGFIFQQMYMMKNLRYLTISYSRRYNPIRIQKHERNRGRGRTSCVTGHYDIADNDINEVSGRTTSTCLHLPQYDKQSENDFCRRTDRRTQPQKSDEVMNELLSLNHDGTTVMCVTHDPKVAAKCSRVLYIVDGGIMGEKEMGHFDGSDKELRDRERDLNNWLMEQGW